MVKGRILLIDDDDSLRRVIRVNLERNDFYVRDEPGGREGIAAIKAESFDVVVTDLTMPEVDGLQVLGFVKETYPETVVILITAYGSVETAVQAMKKGAFDYLTKPFERDELVLLLDKALRMRSLERENLVLRERAGFRLTTDLVAGSPAMARVVDLIGKVGPTDAGVLILGESGTGKELVARAIHTASARHERPLVVVNCAAIPESLMESQLFGHRKGSFTGALEDREGYFQAAHGGTIFLDEIGELRAELQTRLLRVLEQGEVQRVGDSRPHRVDVRVIAATNRDIARGVKEGWFREDLYYRLNVVAVELPPLRERPEDLRALVDEFVRDLSRSRGRLNVADETMELLEHYSWPGNIRELKNVIERAVILCEGETITPAHLPDLGAGLSRGGQPSGELEITLPDEGIDLEDLERSLIVRALERFKGNQTRAAKYLHISRPTLIYRMEKYGLKG